MKINIGRQAGKKYRHLLPSTTETTSQFGFYQPNYFRECVAQDTVNIRSAAAVRLMPVVKPTFGRLFLKQYCNFVPMEDIWHPWSSFLAGKPYNGAYAQYIPQESPTVELGFWNLMCMCMSNIHIFKCTSFSEDSVHSVLSITGVDFHSPHQITDDLRTQVFTQLISKCTTYHPSDFLTFLTTFTSQYGISHFAIGPADNSMSNYDWFFPFEYDGPDDDETLVVCGRFTDAGKNLRKIVIGLGAQLNFDHTAFDFMRFVAYYKTWFDMFAVQREITWKQTVAFSLMEYIEQTGRSLETIIKNSSTYSKPAGDLLHFIFQVLPTCYYTQNPDYISAHIVGTSTSQADSHFNYLDETGDLLNADSYVQEQPGITLSSNSMINQQGLDILKKFYQYTNIATAVGGKIAEFMRAIFGSDYKDEHQSNFIGSNTMELNITDVMSTAETSEGFLGEYAGQGKGADSGQNLHFTCPSAGYLISAFCIVPDARFCQGVDPNGFHKSKFDYYTPQFDSLTLLPSRKSIVYACNDIVPSARYDGGFGNIPNYMEYKQSFDRLNGDLSMRSTRDGLLPFSMQKLISFGEVIVSGEETQENVLAYQPHPDLFVAGEIWRYIGRDRWLGNFDRIFVNSGNIDTFPGSNLQRRDDDIYRSRLDDNFICYFYNDVEVTGYELPVADSFQTDSFGDTLKVEKA